LTNSIRTPLAGQGLDNPTKVIEVAGEPVHAVDEDGVARAHKTQKEFQLGAFGVFPRGFVREGLVDLNPFQLPRNLLIERADADVAKALSQHNILESVKIKSITFCQNCQEMQIWTLG
jgi:hypothetical protein